VHPSARSPHERTESLSHALPGLSLDAYLITQPANLVYFIGVPVRVGVLLVLPDGRSRLLVREQNLTRLDGKLSWCDVVPLPGGGLWEREVAAHLAPRLPPRTGCDEVALPLAVNLSVVAAQTRITPRPDVAASFRRRKDAGEALLLRRAIATADAAARAGFAAIRPGVTELSVVAEMEAALRRAGAEGTRFPTRFGSGPASADCDVEPSRKCIQAGEVGLFDIGPMVEGYLGDISRGFVVGRPTPQQARMAAVALEVLERVAECLRPGERVEKLCAVAQAVYERTGFPQACRHHLGHGLGLAMDPPLIRTGSVDEIDEGDFVAIEPGVYVPGVGGVRFENNYLVRRDGPELLTGFPLSFVIETT
jgi:Xaa-Pro dipeptidase